tara:strand:- start:128 stop:814 length:687 start_codon:yes stop_codon:yes gene_type:complete
MHTVTPKFLFILCPPYQGSTILLTLLNTSKEVSTLLSCDEHGGEGQAQWKRVDREYFSNRWDPAYNLDMDMVKQVLYERWDVNKPIYAEKSPPNICRAKMFEDYFSRLGEVYFLISIRNPYSSNVAPDNWVTFAQYQKHNIESLKNVITTTYEETCLEPHKVIAKLQHILPELGDLCLPEEGGGAEHEERRRPIHRKKVNRVINQSAKTQYLQHHKGLMDYFGYKILQ